MTDFKKHYQQLNSEQLVKVIEEPFRYNPEVISFCKTLVFSKNESKVTLEDYAKLVFYKRFYTYFRNGGHWTDDSIKETSFFLTKSELNECYNNAKIDYLSYIAGATVDLPDG